MSALRTMDKLARDICAEHEAAQHHADQAIDHAKRAGELLMQVKGKVEHGAFLPWVDGHLSVSRRQAQRYMRAAKGEPMTARKLKSDTVSHLPAGTEDGSIWLPDDDSGLMLELEPYRDWVTGAEGVERATVQPVLHVQRCPNDGPHYDVMLLDGDRISYTRKPVVHWAVLVTAVMHAGARRLKAGSMFPMFDPLENEASVARGHARMADLPWEQYEARGFVRSLINIKLRTEGDLEWPLERMESN